MKKLNIHEMDRVLLIVSIILFVFGLLNIVNASSQAVVIRYGTTLYNYFNKQLVSILIGVMFTLIILKIPTKKYYFWGVFSFIIVLGALLYLSLFGTMHQGSINWIKIGPMTFQPSEAAKPVIILIMALLFEKFCKRLQNPRIEQLEKYNLIGIILIFGFIFPLIIFLQKDLGTTIIIAVIFGLLFLASPIRREEKFKAITLAIIMSLVAIIIIVAKQGTLLTPSQASRFDFKDPCSEYEDGGYQICNGFIAINDGGLFGVGIGESKQISYIPESHTDSVFAIISEEYGFIFCSLIFFLFIVVLYRIFNLASRASTIRGKYICFGVGVYLALHIIVNLGGLFGSMPLTGVPLPFLSYGGSFTISFMISLAMVQAVCIETNEEKISI